MASGFIGNEVPRKGLRVRVPCPPLHPVATRGFFLHSRGGKPVCSQRFLLR